MQDLYLVSGISRQGHLQAVQREENQLKKSQCYIGFIEEVRQAHPGMGLRKIYEQFDPEGIGRDAFISLGLQAGYRLIYQPNSIKTTYSVKNRRYRNLLSQRRFTDVNQIWVSDITYYSFGGIFYYIVLIMDVYSRKIVGYNIADNMRAEQNLKALEQALILRGKDSYNNNLIHHSDRGSQYISDDYTNLLEEYEIQISMCDSVYENTHCERVNGTIKNEYLNRWDAKTPRQLYKNMDKAVLNYNERKHNSIGMSPNLFEITLDNIEIEKREILEIYTANINPWDKNQLTLNLDNI